MKVRWPARRVGYHVNQTVYGIGSFVCASIRNQQLRGSGQSRGHGCYAVCGSAGASDCRKVAATGSAHRIVSRRTGRAGFGGLPPTRPRLFIHRIGQLGVLRTGIFLAATVRIPKSRRVGGSRQNLRDQFVGIQCDGRYQLLQLFLQSLAPAEPQTA